MRKGTLYVFTGPSGAGKGTVLSRLLSEDEKLFFSISATTRAPRPGEKGKLTQKKRGIVLLPIPHIEALALPILVAS